MTPSTGSGQVAKRRDPGQLTPQEQQDLLWRLWDQLERVSVLRLGRLLLDAWPRDDDGPGGG